MISAGMESLSGLADLWGDGMLRAVWQGALALAAVWLVGRAWSGMPAQVRCWLWRLAYLKLLVALVWTPSVELPVLPARPVPEPAPRAAVKPPGVSQETPFGAPRLSAAAPNASPAPVPAPPATSTAVLLLFWLLGSAAVGARLWRERRDAGRALQGCQPLVDAHLIGVRDRLSRRLGLRRPPEVLVSPMAAGPWLTGIRQPRIVLPSAVPDGCPPAATELMLAHELVHLQRRDLLWNWFPAAAQALFWFHPLVWLAGHEWRLAQEMACDELAVRLTRAPACDYGEMLLRLAATDHHERTPGWATVGVMESYQSLRRRLLAMKQIERPAPRRLLIGIGALSLIGIGLVPWRVVAQAGSGALETGSSASPRVFQVVRITPSGGTPLPKPGGDLTWHAPKNWKGQPVVQKNRVLAAPGDQVDMEQGQIFVNGRALSEARLEKKSTSWRFRHKLGSGEYLLLGDHLRGRKVQFTFGTVWDSRFVARADGPTARGRAALVSDDSQAQQDGRSEARLKQLGTALRMYAQDYDMVLPPMNDPLAAKKALYSYVRRQDDVFLVPGSDEPYQPNAAVSRHQMVGKFRVQNPGEKSSWFWTVRRGQHPKWMKVNGYITDAANRVAFYEPKPATDGTRMVVFLDGRVARLTESQWQRLKQDLRSP
jgi:beta-lactamase regulating signal transducer with metallopeptidase domain